MASIGLVMLSLLVVAGNIWAEESAEYFPPSETTGGWRALVDRNSVPSSSEKATILALTGVDWDELKVAYDYMRSFYSGTDSLLVIRNGYVVGEWGSDLAFDIASCTKSLTSLAMARLLDLSDQGQTSMPIGEDDLAYQFLPEEWGSADPPRRLIGIRHLMTMSSGLEWHDSPTPTAGYLTTVLTQPADVPPQTVWAYASVPVDLLSIILQDLVDEPGTNLKDFFNTEIASKIGAADFSPWGLMGGYATGSAYSSTSARDLARVGYLTLKKGKWGAEQVISEHRVETLTQWAPFLSETEFQSPGPPPAFANDDESQLRYGRLFWTNRTGQASFVGTGVPVDAYYMAGFNTQFAVIIPSLELIVVRLARGPAPWDDALMSGVLSQVVAAAGHFEDRFEAGETSNWSKIVQ